MRLGPCCLVLALACWSAAAVSASRLAPEDQQQLLPSTAHPSDPPHSTPSTPAAAAAANKKKHKGSIDFEDQDPDVRSHWALLAAGSSGWYNYRHQADVFHAYQVLLAGGYRRDHIVVMAADDIAQDAENPMPGKVFNAPGGPNVYDGVRIDYRGSDVNAENFLSVLLGDKAAMAGKGTGRVVESGPHDKLFVFYSDHGAAGVLGMPNGPFLYADEFIKTLKKKHSRKGFKEAVLYIEACESGSMFEGLLGNDLDIYVTTAANAIESSWATYCPSFDAFAAQEDSAAAVASSGVSNGGGSAAGAVSSTVTDASWRTVLVKGLGWLQQQLGRVTGAPQQQQGVAGPPVPPPPGPQFTTCLGDLYSVAWLEDAEGSNLTDETLLQQYKKVKVRTSQNFTYDQGSHVMQYGDLDIDKELAGDYEGMNHNGTKPSPTVPSQDWIDYAAAQEQQQQQGDKEVHPAAAVAAATPGSTAALLQYSSPDAFIDRLKAKSSRRTSPSHGHKGHHSKQHHHQHQHQSVQQRDADLVPLAVAAEHAPCPRRRAAAAAALRKATAARQSLEAAARGAVAGLLKQPAAGHVLITRLGWNPAQVLMLQGTAGTVGSASHQQQQQQQRLGESSLAVGDAVESYVEALMGPLPDTAAAGGALVGDWSCLRSMVQAWEGQCGQLDQYGMKLTRLFANLCNAGVQPQQLTLSLAGGPCRSSP